MNTHLSRRTLLKALGLGSFAMIAPMASALANTNPKVVVVGGGFAGATAVKYLKRWGGLSVDVTLVEPNAIYHSPILSNLVLNGQKTTSSLQFTYATHQNKYGVNVINDRVLSIDKVNKTVLLSGGATIAYDKLILAPGIDFIPIAGLDSNKVPHAWQGGAGIDQLKSQIETMVDGEDFVMSIPSAPYRCPPGPYERACVVADYLKNVKGFASSRVIVLDENPDITVEAAMFHAQFAGYGIDYRPNSTVLTVNSDTKQVDFDENGTPVTLTPKVLNVIPNQKAAQLLFDTGLVVGNWAPVNPLSYESTLDSNIHIIGDSQGTGQPKAGHIGNSEAKVCADAVLRILNNLAPDPAPKTNSACYSPVSRTAASWLSAVYEYNPTTQQMQLVANAGYPKSQYPTTSNYWDMFNWSGNLFADTFN